MRVPVLATDRDTPLHRRDPRVKWLVFVGLVIFLYLAPTWHWMVAMSGVGLAMAAISRTPGTRLLVLWLLQVPNFLALVLVPIVGSLWDDGRLELTANLEFSLKLGFAWSAALFVAVPLFSSMQIEDLVDGLHGLRLPHVVGFTIGYAFVLLYTSAGDILRIADAMKIKGLRLETRNPLRFLAAVPRMLVPAVFTIIRRANTMMAVMEMRGFSATSRGGRRAELALDRADVALLAVTGTVLAAAAAVRFGLLSA